MNARRKRGTPAKYHEFIQDSGYKDGAACPEFIKPLFKDEIINGRASSIAMILTTMQLGGYTRENICHPSSWATQIFCKHHRVLAGLETERGHAVFVSGDGIPKISRGLVSDAMQDIDVSCPLYRPNPIRRLAANNTEVVVSQCLENVQSGAQPDAHNTIDPTLCYLGSPYWFRYRVAAF